MISLGAPLQTRKFVKKHWRFPKKVAIAALKRYPRPDYYLLKRSPKLSVSENHLGVKLVDQTSLYLSDFEVRKNSEPYHPHALPIQSLALHLTPQVTQQERMLDFDSLQHQQE